MKSSKKFKGLKNKKYLPNIDSDIAVIGMACRFPGAGDYTEFWENLEKGTNSIAEVPSDRWDWREYFGITTNSKWGGFIEDIDKFDALFFSISPKEAESMDPQQRIMLELTWSCIEDAGYAPESFSGKNVGVFLGACNFDYKEIQDRYEEDIATHFLTNTLNTYIPNRISHFFNFHGPSIAIDAACASSLVAVHQAIQSLRNKESEVALAGGINILCCGDRYIPFSKLGMLSPTGQCKSFDASADGYVRGEGAGIIMLKPLKQAIADKNFIYATIKGSATNHGGRAKTVTSPNVYAQSQAIISACQQANISPETISYIETHGTGTSLGDPIEIHGLRRAFTTLFKQYRKNFPKKSFCGLGSVKTNIGHLESAAGIAGIIKVILAMQYKKLPALQNFEKINPRINLTDNLFYLVDKLIEWKVERHIPRRAGVSSFGLGGVNAHVVMEEYIPEESQKGTPSCSLMIVLSAKNTECLQDSIKKLLEFIQKNSFKINLFDLAYTLQMGREAMEERLGLIVSSVQELEDKLQSLIEGKEEVGDVYHGHVKRGKDHLAFVPLDDEMVKTTDHWIKEREYSKLINLWVKGLIIDWNKLYKEQKPCRINLPTYPFMKSRHWLRSTAEKTLTAQKNHSKASNQHYMLPEPLQQGVDWFFHYNIAVQSNILLREHLVYDRYIFPTDSWIELLYASGASYFKKDALKLKQLYIKSFLQGFEDRAIHVVHKLIERGDGDCEAIITSEQLEHIKCFLSINHEPKPDIGRFNLSLEREKNLQFKGLFPADYPIEVKAFFQSAQDFQFYGKYGVVELVLPDAALPYRDQFYLQPSLLDGVLGGVVLCAHQNVNISKGETFVPVYIEEVQVFDRLNETEYTAIIEPVLIREEFQRFNVYVLNGKQEVVIFIKELDEKRIDGGQVQTNLAVDKMKMGESVKEEIPSLLTLKLKELIAEILMVDPTILDVDKRFQEHGVDSILSMEIVKKLNNTFDLTLKSTVLYEHSTLNELKTFLLSSYSQELQKVLLLDQRGYQEDLVQIAQTEQSRIELPKLTLRIPSAIPAKKIHEPQNEVEEGSLREGSPGRVNASLGKEELEGSAFPLTDLQESFLVGRQISSGQDDVVGCHIYLEIEFQNLDIPRLNQAWNRLVAHHEMLRAVILSEGKQRILKEVPIYFFAVHSLQDKSSGEFEKHLQSMRGRMSHKVYQTEQYPLFHIEITECAAGRTLLHFSIDEWIVDGMSVFLLLDQWAELYANPNAPLSPLGLSFREYILKQKAHSALPSTQQKMSSYWLKTLAHLPPDPFLSKNRTLHHESLQNTKKRMTLRKTLPCEKWSALKEYAKGGNVSPSMMLLTLFAEVLAVKNEHKDFSLILTTLNRSPLHPDIKKLIGPLTSTLIFKANAKPGKNFKEKMRESQQQILEGLEYSDMSGIEVLRKLKTSGSIPPDFSLGIVFTSLLLESFSSNEKDYSSHWFQEAAYIEMQTPQVYLDHQVWEHKGELHVYWYITEEEGEGGILRNLFSVYCDALLQLADNSTLWYEALPIDGVFPLTDVQQAYCVSRTGALQNGMLGCTSYQEWIISNLDVKRLETAWQRLISRHNMLRAVITEQGKQKVLTEVPPYAFEQFDLRYFDEQKSKERLDEIRKTMANKIFPLDGWPYFDIKISHLNGQISYVHTNIDLLIADGQSLQLIYQEWFKLYQAPQSSTLPLSYSFREYVMGKDGVLQTSEGQHCLNYWLTKFSHLPPGPFLSQSSGYARSSHRLSFTSTQLHSLKEMANRQNVSLDLILLTAYADTLSSVFTDPFTLVVVGWERPPSHSDIDKVVGDFSSLSWLAVNPAKIGVMSYIEKLEHYSQQLAEDKRHQSVSGLHALRRMALQKGQHLSFPVVYTCLLKEQGNFPPTVQLGTGLTQTPQVALDVIPVERGTRLDIHWDYVKDLFPLDQVEALHSLYCQTLENLAHQLLDTSEGVLHTLIEAQVQRTPFAPAVNFLGEQLSYQVLNERANRLARYLIRQGVTKDSLVGICIERSTEMLIGLLAILKAGGAYVPIDPHYPDEWIKFIIQDAQLNVMLTDAHLKHKLCQCVKGTVLALDRDMHMWSMESAQNPSVPIHCENLIYVLYTSGSTGQPKGCLLTHKAVCNRLIWMQQAYPLSSHDRVMQKTPFTFDVSVWELFWPLLSGASLSIVKPGGHQDNHYLAHFIQTERISVCHFVPSMLQLFLNEPEVKGCNTLKHLFTSGEALPYSLMVRCLETLPEVRLHNLYGPTEAAIDVTAWDCQLRLDGKVPIGKPIHNLYVEILDENLKTVPEGIAGELHIGGLGLARGYLHRESLTQEKFIVHPTISGERLYKTGDVACYLPDGNIEYRGRLDSQVKVRGFRIELGEIEQTLLMHPEIQNAVVSVQGELTGDPTLVAYVITTLSSDIRHVTLRSFLESKLPSYMVPSFFVSLAKLPLTHHGKIDRKALPWPLQSEMLDNSIQTQIMDLFKNLLHNPALQLEEDLFNQGATSLTMVRASQQIYVKFKQHIPIEVFLSEPTVLGITKHLLQKSLPCQNKSENQLCSQTIERERGFDFFSEEKREAFKSKQMNIRKDERESALFPLISQLDDHPQIYNERSSQHPFESGKKISFANLSGFLSLLKQGIVDGQLKYRYPSAGATYAVQTYLYAKEGAIEGLPEGFYYYHPVKQHLSLLSKASLENSHQFYYNRAHFETAGFCLYFIGQLAAITPIYGNDMARHFTTLEAGYMGQLLMMHQADFQLGLRPIGDIDFERIRHHFNLSQEHYLIHSFIGGSVKYSSRLKAKDDFCKLAIVGVSGRYPGAANPLEFWENLQKGKSTLAPLERRGVHLTKGGYLSQIDHFDHFLFNMTPFEARNTDPQERQFLEVVWECLENAGYTSERLNKHVQKVGVFIGAMWNDYQNFGVEPARSFHSSIANRVSHFFNFTGPSMAIDTSCSSALSALHLACESIKRGECGAAIVGGVNLISHPYHQTLLSNLGLLSQNENNAAFQADGSGWLPGEGVGAILILPAALAEKNNDSIYALIKGTAINHSGRSVRFAAPNFDAQVSAIQDALMRANITPSQIDYIELAAAGASLADISELEALKRVFGKLAPHSLTIGTVKPNIGHLESASGLSQLTKVLLQMRHKKIAPTLVSAEINPMLNLAHSPFRITSMLEEWTKPSPVLALINAFGATGSCGHVILEEHMPLTSNAQLENKPFLIVLSAETEQQLRDSAERLQFFLRSSGGSSLSEIAYTLQVGRVEMRKRMAMVVRNMSELKEGLRSYLEGKEGAITELYVGSFDGVDKDAIAANRQTALSVIAKQWAQEGARVEWELLYDIQPRKIALPTYPFSLTSHWFDDHPSEPCSPQVRSDSLLSKTLFYLRHVFAQEAEIPLENLKGNVELGNYGIHSLLIKKLNARLEKEIGALSKTLFYEYPTLEALAQFLIKEHSEQLLKKFQLEAGINTENLSPTLKSSFESSPQKRAGKNENEDIAIIGISGRYPHAPHLDAFWENLKAGKNSVTEVPLERWDNLYYHNLLKQKLGGSKNYSQWGAFLDEVDTFDSLFFNISPREAESMDPQERLFLELSWKALEDAAYTPSLLKTHFDNRVGVFAGVMYNEYQLYGAEETVKGNPIALSLGYGSIANRVSYFLDLQGPSLAVDTLCSSSLTAIHLACKSLHQRECDMAMAGGVSLILHPNRYILHAQMNMTSQDGRCRSFGEGGDGFVAGEGAGVLILRRLSDAIETGDRIQGIIKGSALNHGGKTQGYTVPNPILQGKLIEAAFQQAQVEPHTISYIEAHGTGTSLGDPIEITGLSRAFQSNTLPVQSCAIGSVKSNIGHLEAAAGIAALTKVLLQFKHQKLVPSLHAESLNSNINFANTPFYVQRELSDWEPKNGYPRRAGVSSFGAGGANVHLILEEAPKQPSLRHEKNKPYYLVALSAKNEESLKERIVDLHVYLKDNTDLSLEEVAYTLNIGRCHFNFRCAIVASDLEELKNSLENVLQKQTPLGCFKGQTENAPEDAAIYEEVLSGLIEKLKQVGQTAPHHYQKQLFALANLYVKGYDIDWVLLHQGENHRRVGLPTYPFLKKRYWYDSHSTSSSSESIKDIQLKKENELETPLLKLTPLTQLPVKEELNGLTSEEIIKELSHLLVNQLFLESSEVNIDKKFVDYGLDSINAVEMIRAINKKWKLNLPVTQLYDHPTVKSLAIYLNTIILETAVQSNYGSKDCVDLASSTAVSRIILSKKNDEPQKECHRRDDESLAKEELEGIVYPSLKILGAGGIEELSFQNHPPDSLGPEDLLIEVHFSSVILPDVLCVKGLYPTMPPYPFSAGFEFAGRVVKIGGEVKGYQNGDRVFGVSGEKLGAHKALLTVNANFISLIPACLSDDAACTLPEAFLTAYYALMEVGKLQKGEKILIHSAASGTGLMAIQLAQRQGAKIYATVGSQEKVEYLQQLGIEYVANYREESFDFSHFMEYVPGKQVDLVLNMLVGTLRQEALSILAPFGRYLDLAVAGLRTKGTLDFSKLVENQVYHSIDCKRLLHKRPGYASFIFKQLQYFVEEGTIKPLKINRIYPFFQAKEAYTHVNHRLGIGKVLLDHTTLIKMGPDSFFSFPESKNKSATPAKKNYEPNSGKSQLDIAVVGISGRFPGATDVNEFWNVLREGRDVVTEIPKERWDKAAFYDSTPQMPGKTSSKWGGFLKGIDEFDPSFFQIAPLEAEQMDPQQRVFLEECWHALEDAGYAPGQLAGQACGVFVGVGPGDYHSKMVEDNQLTAHHLLGSSNSILAARIAYLLDLTGPAIAIDTACSSSLVALHQACQSLREGECEMALAGGVCILTTPKLHIMTSYAGMLSFDGKCKTFGNQADGFVPAEGVGVVVLKPLAKALLDKDQIYGVIKGSGINQDGATNGITAPSARSQEQLQKSIYKKYEINPRDISYVEAHGTGTKLGDPIEVQALREVFKEYTSEKSSCAIGSVKTNIGHTLTSAGVAGVIKVLLCLRHKEIVPSLHFNEPNEHIDFSNSPFYVNTKLKSWKKNETKPRLATISSFGFSGTNAHMVIEEAPEQLFERKRIKPYYLVTLSAKHPDSLKQRIIDLANYLGRHPELSLEDVAYTLNIGRSHFHYRCALVVSHLAELKTSLEKHISTGYFKNEDKNVPENLEAMANLYVSGSDLNWEMLHQGESHQKISLPTYPFLKERYWSSYPSKEHPFLDSHHSTHPTHLFKKRVTAEDFYFVDHKVSGEMILPGTFYLEMARAAGALSVGREVISLQEVIWLRPIVCQKLQQIDIWIELNHLPGVDQAAFNIFTQCEKERLVHVEGQINYEFSPEDDQPKRLNIADIQAACRVCIDNKESIYKRLKDFGFEYGDSFQVSQAVYGSHNAGLIKLKLPLKCELNYSAYVAHPSMMDAALRSVFGINHLINDRNEQEVKLPFYLQKILFYKAIPKDAYAYATLSGSSQFNVAIVNSEGEVCVFVKSFITRKLPSAAPENPEFHYYQPVWMAQSIEQSKVTIIPPLLIINAREDRLAEDIIQGNKIFSSVIHVKNGKAFAQVNSSSYTLRMTEVTDYALLYASLQAEKIFPENVLLLLPDIQAISMDGVLACLSFFQAWHVKDSTKKIRMVSVYLAKDDHLQPEYQALPILERCIVHLSPLFSFKTVAMHPLRFLENIPNLLSEFMIAENQSVHYSVNKRLVRTLHEIQFKHEKKSVLRQGGVYLITGGNGGLGRLFASYLAKNTQAKLILVGRSALNEEINRFLESLRELGADAVYIRTDIGESQSTVDDLIANILHRFGELNGILHAAGMIAPSSIDKISPTDFEQAVRAKTAGTYFLDQATLAIKLDFFAGFSSISSEMGDYGLGSYAYGNRFLDEYIANRSDRVASGKCHGKCISLQWPYWQEGNMHLPDKEAKIYFDYFGLRMLDSLNGLKIFEESLKVTSPNILVMPGDKNKTEHALNLKTAVQDAKAMQDFDSESLLIGAEHSQKVQAAPIKSDCGSKDCVALASSTAVFRLKLPHSKSIDLLSEIQKYLIGIFSEITRVPINQVNASQPMQSYGADSIMFVSLNRRLHLDFPKVSKTIFFEHQTLQSLAAFLLENFSQEISQLLKIDNAISNPILDVVEKSRGDTTPFHTEDIAVIGLSGRYPQADNLTEFWKNLQSGRDCIENWPEKRSQILSKDSSHYKGGFIREIDGFDAKFFNLIADEAEIMTPELRLLFEVTWEVFENAGYTRPYLTRYQKSQKKGIGVYIANMYYQYGFASEQIDVAAQISVYTPATIANRISHFFNFQGPSMTLDAACAGSLTAIHLACESLRKGESSLALAGGINLHLHPAKYDVLIQGGMISKKGKSSALGQGDGYVPGEGAGMVLLKPLHLAIQDGDTILGVIKAGTITHGGNTHTYTLPNPVVQAESIVNTLKKANVDPNSIGYVESAANGSRIGDALEVAGLIKAFRALTNEIGFCALGTVKSNIGHLEAACGISQLTKVLLQFREKQLVPTIHAEPLNPDIDLKDSPFYLQTSLMEWKSSKHPRRALINSFGAVGTNANILVEEYIQTSHPLLIEKDTPKPFLFLFSAKTPKALKIFIRSVMDFLNTNPTINLIDLAYTLQAGREPMIHGVAVKANHKEDLMGLLTGYINGNLSIAQTSQVIELSKHQESDVHLSNGELSLNEHNWQTLAHAWIYGREINWKQLYGHCLPKCLILPNYPFQRQSFWLKAHLPLPEPKKFASSPSKTSEVTGIENHLLEMLGNMLQLPKNEIEVNKKLIEYGIDSLRSMRLLNRINHDYQLDLETHVLVHDSTIASLAERILQQKSSLHLPKEAGEFPQFIERKIFTLETDDQLIQAKNIENQKLFTHFLEMGIGLYKTADQLIVEYAKNGISDEVLKKIEEAKTQLSACMIEGEKYYPLSFSQKMMCIQTELYKNESYRLILPYSFSTSLEPDLLQQSLQVLSDRHEILRTTFSKINNILVQIVHKNVKTNIEIVNYFGDAEQNKQHIANLLKQQKLHHFDLNRGPLYELKLINMSQSQMIILDIHHAICDGVAASFFMNELMTNYKRLAQGHKHFPSSIYRPLVETSHLDSARRSPIEPCVSERGSPSQIGKGDEEDRFGKAAASPNGKFQLEDGITQYAHFVLDQFKINAKIESDELAWWQEKLKDAPLQCPVPYDYQSNSKLQIHGGLAYIKFSEKERFDIREFCQKNHISLTLFILSSIYTVLHLWTHEKDMIVGATSNQRHRFEYEDQIGDFINLIPLRICLTSMTTGRELLALVKSVFSEASAHQKITFNKLAQKLRVKRNNANLPFYNILLDSLNLAAFDKNEASSQYKFELFNYAELLMENITPLMDFSFLLAEDVEEIILGCIYRKDLFKSETIDNLFAALKVILVKLMQEPDKSVCYYYHFNTTKKKSENLFCLPGGDGGHHIFKRILKTTSAYTPFAIKYKTLEQDHKVRIEEVARDAIVITQNFKAPNVFSLMGLSYGGLVAFEVCRQLNEVNRKPNHLILIDPPSVAINIDTQQELKSLLNVNMNILSYLFAMNWAIKAFGHKTNDIMIEDDFFERVNGMSNHQIAQFAYEWIKENTAMALPTLQSFNEWVKTLMSHIFSIQDYLGISFDAKDVKVALITPEDGTNPLSLLLPTTFPNKKMDKSIWPKLLIGAEFHHFTISDSNHYSMFNHANLEKISEKITEFCK